MQLKFPKTQRGAFLVIALILLIVLSAVGIAAMTMAVTANRTGRNYSQYLDAQIKAVSMAGYAKRILETYTNGVYSGPGTCNSSGTCNVIDNNFPNSGRPVLAWTSGLGSAIMVRSSESNSWWTTNGFAYEASFAGSGNERVVVSRAGVNTSSPYENTYRIVGYATDTTDAVKSTYDLYHVWLAYQAAPGNGTCAGGCNYAQCCSSGNTCAGDQTSCEGGSATYVPPGWTCTAYFVTGLGYASSACNNPIAPP